MLRLCCYGCSCHSSLVGAATDEDDVSTLASALLGRQNVLSARMTYVGNVVDDSVRLVVRSRSLVRADVAGVLRRVRTAGGALALAGLVEAFLVAARVLARVRQTVDAAVP